MVTEVSVKHVYTVTITVTPINPALHFSSYKIKEYSYYYNIYIRAIEK